MRFVARIVGFVAIGFVAFMPFTRNYATAYSSIEDWKGSLTPWWAYLNIHLLFLFPIVTLIMWEIKRWGWRWWRALWQHGAEALALGGDSGRADHRRGDLLVVSGQSGCGHGRCVGASRQQRDVILIAVPIMLACVLLAIRPRLAVAYRFWYFIVFLAVALTRSWRSWC